MMDTSNIVALSTKRPHQSDSDTEINPGSENMVHPEPDKKHANKRQNTGTDSSSNVSSNNDDKIMLMSEDEHEPETLPSSNPVTKMSLVDMHKESRFGIDQFVYNATDYTGFTGVLKTRSTDFIVRELDPAGEPVYLTDLNESITPPTPVRSVVVNESCEGLHPAFTSSERIADFMDKIKSLVIKSAPTSDTQHEAEFIRSLESNLSKLSDNEFLCHNCEPAICIKSEHGIADKQVRKEMHTLVQDLLPNSYIASNTDTNDGSRFVMSFGPLPRSVLRSNQGRSQYNPVYFYKNLVWKVMGGEYISFAMYKDNSDAHVALSELAKRLGVPPNTFMTAGTKDKRAVTIQRVTAHKVLPKDLMAINHPKSRILTGNFQVAKQHLRLGDLSGNRFTVVVRQIAPADPTTVNPPISEFHQSIANAFESFKANGFINYFGLQRFGTSSVTTSEIGAALLAQNWRLAVSLILDPREHDMAEYQEARRVWKSTRDARAAMHLFPPCAVAERAVLGYLSRNKLRSPTLVFGDSSELNEDMEYDLIQLKSALTAITPNLLSMYVNAFQSLVWNNVTSARIRLFGFSPVVGDLVMVAQPAISCRVNSAAISGDGIDHDASVCTETALESVPNCNDNTDIKSSTAVESNILDQSCDIDNSKTDIKNESITADSSDNDAESDLPTVISLTKEMIDSGVYKITDIVLPGPGFQIKYPEQEEIRKVYEEALSKFGLSLNDNQFASKISRSLRLPGVYRRCVVVPENVNYEILEDLDSKASIPQSFTDDDNDKLVLIDQQKLVFPKSTRPQPSECVQDIQPPGQDNDQASIEPMETSGPSVPVESPLNKDMPTVAEIPDTSAKLCPDGEIILGDDSDESDEQRERGVIENPIEETRPQPVPGYALKLMFSLPPASYATMALRELMRVETASSAHAERTTRFNGPKPRGARGRGFGHRGSGSFNHSRGGFHHHVGRGNFSHRGGRGGANPRGGRGMSNSRGGHRRPNRGRRGMAN